MTNRDTLDAERADLLAHLATVRSALIRSVQGLSDEQATERPTASALCLAGLIKHVTQGEENWRRFMEGDRSAIGYELPDGVTWNELMAGTARTFPQWMIDYQNGFQMLPGETLAGLLSEYEATAARTEETVASLPDLSATQPLPEAPWSEERGEWSARRTLLHIIEETAQHAGHADIIRETLDGRAA